MTRLGNARLPSLRDKQLAQYAAETVKEAETVKKVEKKKKKNR